MADQKKQEKRVASWEDEVLLKLLEVKADLLNLPETVGRKSFVRWLLGESEPNVDAFLNRLHVQINNAIDIATGRQNYLFNKSVRRVTPEEIRKQMMEIKP